ncbi:hypothetical protein N9Y42_10410, partial [Mariniblastus sp.]|nr:hypothetical protein [Mariniblastus sp.]
MLPRRLLFVAALTCFSFLSAYATTASAGPILLQEPAQPQPAAQPGQKAKPEAKERLELLMKHKFDRTPKGILEAWSADKVKKKKKKKEEDEKEPITAEVTNAFKDFVFLQLKDEQSAFKKDQILNVLDDKQKIIGKIKILTIDGKEISARTEALEPEKKEGEEKAKSKSNDAKDTDAVPESPKAEEAVTEMTIGRAVGSNTRTYTVTIPVSNQDQDLDEKLEEVESGSDDEGNSTDDADAKDGDGKEKSKEKKAPAKPVLAVKTGDTIELRPIDAKEKAKQQTERLQAEVKEFARNVSLGNWDKVKEYLTTKTKDKKEAQKLYVYILNELMVSMPEVPKNGAAKRAQAEARGESPPKSVLSPMDVLALSEISPEPISIIEFKDRKSNEKSDDKSEDKKEKEDPAKAGTDKVAAKAVPKPKAGEEKKPAQPKPDPKKEATKLADDATSIKEVTLLSTLLKQTIDAGYDIKPFLKKIQEGTAYFGGDDLDKRLTAAHLLMQCNLYDEAEKFIPAVDDEKSKDNIYVLRIWKQIADIRYQKKRENKWLKKIWDINQNIFLSENSAQTDIDLALTRLIDIAPQMDKDVGQKWLDDSFVESPERGVQILAALGKLSAANLSRSNSNQGEERLRMLKLQNRAVEKVLEVSPEIAEKWVETLTVLANNWISEAKISIKEAPNGSKDMDVDRYGNYYWNRYSSNTSSKNPIKIIELIPLLPSDKWQSHISPLLLTEIKVLRSKLHMHIKEYDKSFALIQELAGKDKKLGQELAEEFLKVWTDFNDPNSSRNQRNDYYYYYGYNQKAESIPLTRSKQDRSLSELSKWAAEVRALPIEDIDENLLVTAFQTCYSAAEVFSTQRMEAVLGDISKLKPKTIASLSQTMRINLSGQWRSVKNQEENKTKRTAPEILREVQRGYLVARDMTQKAIDATPTNWQLQLAKACLEMDQNEFHKEFIKTGPTKTEYSELRKQAMGGFAEAAQLYIQQADELERKDLKTEVFDRWFYAALGAVDLGKLTAKTLPMNSEFPKIKAAIQQLPPEVAEIHMDQFANNLFARMEPIPPELKFRY